MKHTTLPPQNPQQETLAFLKDFARLYQPEQAVSLIALLLKKKKKNLC